MVFIAYACVCRTNENCKSHVLQDKCNIEIFLSPVAIQGLKISVKKQYCVHFSVRDRQRTKMERDILADVNHPFIVRLSYGKLKVSLLKIYSLIPLTLPTSNFIPA